MRQPLPRSFATSNKLRFAGQRLRISYSPSPPSLDAAQEAYASAFLNDRHIVLHAELRRNRRERRRILTHEVFHFVWRRLGNPARATWRALVAREFEARARGELGWSAEWRKKLLSPADIKSRTRLWRDYSCEAFCDTAAWLYCGLRAHEEFTLAPKWRNLRRAWFVEYIEGRELRL